MTQISQGNFTKVQVDKTLSHLSVYESQLPSQHHPAHGSAHLVPGEGRPLGLGEAHGLRDGPATLDVHLHVGVRLLREAEDAPRVGVQPTFDVLATRKQFQCSDIQLCTTTILCLFQFQPFSPTTKNGPLASQKPSFFRSSFSSLKLLTKYVKMVNCRREGG